MLEKIRKFRNPLSKNSSEADARKTLKLSNSVIR